MALMRRAVSSLGVWKEERDESDERAGAAGARVTAAHPLSRQKEKKHSLQAGRRYRAGRPPRQVGHGVAGRPGQGLGGQEGQ